MTSSIMMYDETITRLKFYFSVSFTMTSLYDIINYDVLCNDNEFSVSSHYDINYNVLCNDNEFSYNMTSLYNIINYDVLCNNNEIIVCMSFQLFNSHKTCYNVCLHVYVYIVVDHLFFNKIVVKENKLVF